MALKDLAKDKIDKLYKLLELGINPFNEKRFEKSLDSKIFSEKYKKLGNDERSENIEKFAGRVMSIRHHGKISFSDIYDEFGKIQIVFKIDETEDFDKLELIERGDFIGIEGIPYRTKRGELSLIAKKWKILSKSIRPIPDQWFGLKDVETRYRERYLDFVLNPEKRNIFRDISKMLYEIRNFLNERGFIEVNTPILQPVYGGAFARPFKTFFHALNEERYLRIAPELYLKRLLVGGFEKVYEFAPCFRNESIDSLHNPEFIQIELYWAYANYEDIMNLLEELLTYIVKKVKGSLKIEYKGEEIDFSTPWKRIRMVDAIKEESGIDVENLSDEELGKIVKDLGYEEGRRGEMIEKLFDHYVKDKIVNPTFVIDFPVDITPLAKRKNEKYAERFELYIAGMEVANAYTELNNPIEQYERFKEEEELRKKINKKDFEFMPMDKDYVRALEYGMPPAGGLGIGLGRLFMILENQASLKEVLLFPAVSKEEDVELVTELFPEMKDKLINKSKEIK